MSSNTINMLVRFTLGALVATLLAPPGLALATHRSFTTEAENWTGREFRGQQKTWTFFADVDGDEKADAIAVYNDGVWFRRSDGTRFEDEKPLTSTAFYGDKATFFADVDRDGKADPIAVYKDRPILVRESKTQRRREWTEKPFYGNVKTFFADVNGDGTADAIAVDAIAVNKWKVTVRRSMAKEGINSFGPIEDWTPDPNSGLPFSPGTRGTFFANVIDFLVGDKGNKADLIVVNDDGVTVWMSNNGRFVFGKLWTLGPYPAYYGTLGTFFADVTGDGKADAIAVNGWIAGDEGIAVRDALGADDPRIPEPGKVPYYGYGFRSPQPGNIPYPGIWVTEGGQAIREWGYWTRDAFYGTRGTPATFFADVTGDGTADAIAVKEDGIWVRRSCFKDSTSDPSCPRF